MQFTMQGWERFKLLERQRTGEARQGLLQHRYTLKCCRWAQRCSATDLVEKQKPADLPSMGCRELRDAFE